MYFQKSIAVLLLCALIVILAPHALPGQSGILYMLALKDNRDAGEVGLALSNPTLETVTVRVALRGYDGSLLNGSFANPLTLELPPLGQRAFTTRELFGSGPQPGWAEFNASSESIGGVFMLFDPELRSMDGAELAAAPASRLIFPHITTDPSSRNEIVVVNRSEGTLSDVALSLFNNNGQLAAQKYFTLTPHAGFSSLVETLAPDAGGFEGYAVVETTSADAPAALLGFETYRRGAETAALNALPEAGRWRSAYQSYVVAGKGYQSRLVLLNYGTEPQAVRITLIGLKFDGTPVSGSAPAVEQTIPAGGRWVGDVRDVFGLADHTLAAGAVHYQVLAGGAGLTGYAEVASADGHVAALPAKARGFSNLTFAQVAEGSQYHTGIALLNPTTQQGVVSVELTNTAGQTIGSRSIALAPGEQRSQLVRELVDVANQMGGSLHVRSTHEVLAMGALSHTNSMAFMTGFGNQPEPQASGRMVQVGAGATLVASGDLATISIPPHSLGGATQVGIRSMDARSLPTLAAQARVAGAVELTPDNLPLSIPALVNFRLESEFTPGYRMRLARYAAGANEYQSTDLVAVVDPSGRTASVAIPRLMTLAALVPPSDNAPLVPPGGGPGEPAAPEAYISSVSPSRIHLPAAATSLTVTGRGFSRDTLVRFDNLRITPAYTDSTSLVVPLRADQLTPGAHSISASGANGAASNTMEVFVGHATPALSSVSAATTAGRVKLTGTGFTPASMVLVNGARSASEYRGPTELEAALPGAGATVLITVSNPAPGGGVSNALAFKPAAAEPPLQKGKSLYVSPAGSEGGNGSLANPYKSIARAIAASGPGDTIFLRQGTYNEAIEMRGDRRMGGSPAGWWTIQSYPGEVATLADDFDAYSVQYCIFQNLNFSPGAKLFVGRADWLNPPGERSHHIEIRNNTFTGPQIRYGFMEVMLDHSLIERNTIVSTGGGTTTDHGIYLHYGTGNTLRGNVISGTSGYAIHVYDERKRTTDPQTFITDLTIEENVLSQSRRRSGLIISQGNDTVVNGVIVRNNIMFNNAEYGIDLTNYGEKEMNNLRIYHNTLHGNGDGGILIGKNSITGSEVRNNIISVPASTTHIKKLAPGPIGLGVYNNLYWPGPVRVTNFDDGHPVVGDPLFVNPHAGDFHIQTGSAAIGRAVVTTEVSRDKDGTPRTGAPDLGAYEH